MELTQATVCKTSPKHTNCAYLQFMQALLLLQWHQRLASIRPASVDAAFIYLEVWLLANEANMLDAVQCAPLRCAFFLTYVKKNINGSFINGCTIVVRNKRFAPKWAEMFNVWYYLRLTRTAPVAHPLFTHNLHPDIIPPRPLWWVALIGPTSLTRNLTRIWLDLRLTLKFGSVPYRCSVMTCP